MPGPMNPAHALRDEFWLVGREELQLRFGLNEKFVKLWMEAKPEDRLPHILTGKKVPMFKPADVWGWLKAKFGQGYAVKVEGGASRVEAAKDRVRTGKVGRPRAFAS